MNIEPLQVLPYDLPDIQIIGSEKDFDFFFWQPDKRYLILGQSNKPETSLFFEKVQKDNIPIYKRPSGGETVILTPNMLVLALSFTEKTLKNPKEYFVKINSVIIEALTNLGIKNLCQKGISDICIDNKKILGSSIYRKPGKVFYHAVLNVSEEIHIIAKYLKHPSKEPDYRKGRSHEEFVTSLKSQGYLFNTDVIAETIKTFFDNRLKKLLFPDDNFSEKR